MKNFIFFSVLVIIYSTLLYLINDLRSRCTQKSVTITEIVMCDINSYCKVKYDNDHYGFEYFPHITEKVKIEVCSK